MQDSRVYFAYGSNMFSPRLRFRVPGAEVLGQATLRGYQLRFHKRSGKDGSAKCDAYKTENDDNAVRGVLYRIPVSQLGDLHRAEGRGYGYNDAEVPVWSPDGTSQIALTYLAAASHVVADLRPFSWYWDFVVAGAREHGLPEEYVAAFIAPVAHDPDPDRKQDRDERAKVSGEPHLG